MSITFENLLNFIIIPYITTLILYYLIVWFNTRNTPSNVADPYHTSALMTNGGFGIEDKDDTVIHAVMKFDSIITKEDLIKCFKERNILKHTGFSCIPATEPKNSSRFVWKPVEHMILAKHFIVHNNNQKEEKEKTLNEKEIDDKIQDICNNQNTTIRKEGDKMPWWRVHIMVQDGKRSVIIMCIHHGVADGLGCLRVFSSILSSDRKGTPIDNTAFFSPARSGSGDPLGRDRGIFANILKPWKWPRAIVESIDFWLCFLWTAFSMFLFPGDTKNDFMSFGRDASLTDFYLNPKNLPKLKNVMVPMPRHSLDLIKKIKNAAGRVVTVNDVEYALYAGMMRRYLIKFGGMKESEMNSGVCNFRSMTPFNVPHPIPEGKLYSHTMVNSWSFLINQLPTAPTSAKDRLKLSNKMWAPVKKRSFVPAAFSTTRLAGDLGTPLFLQQAVCRMLFSKCSVIFSNLPGPAEDELFICGAKLESVNAFHPCATQQAIVISIFGEMHYSLTVPMNEELEKRNGSEGDVRVALPKLFLEELDELRMEMGV